METTGIIKVIFDTQRVSDKFQKRDFVLTTEAGTPYPQSVSFQATKDKCDALNNFKVGDEIKVNFNLKGREWQDSNTLQTKFFNTLEAWKIEKL